MDAPAEAATTAVAIGSSSTNSPDPDRRPSPSPTDKLPSTEDVQAREGDDDDILVDPDEEDVAADGGGGGGGPRSDGEGQGSPAAEVDGTTAQTREDAAEEGEGTGDPGTVLGGDEVEEEDARDSRGPGRADGSHDRSDDDDDDEPVASPTDAALSQEPSTDLPPEDGHTSLPAPPQATADSPSASVPSPSAPSSDPSSVGSTAPAEPDKPGPASAPIPPPSPPPSSDDRQERPQSAKSAASLAEMPPPLMTATGVMVNQVLREGDDPTEPTPAAAEDKAAEAPTADAKPTATEAASPSAEDPVPEVTVAPPEPAPLLPPPPPKPRPVLDLADTKQRAIESLVSSGYGPQATLETLRSQMSKTAGAILFGLLSFNQSLLSIYTETASRPEDEVKVMRQEIEDRMRQNLAWLAAVADADQKGIAPSLAIGRFPELHMLVHVTPDFEHAVCEILRKLVYFTESTRYLEGRIVEAAKKQAAANPIVNGSAPSSATKRARSDTVDSAGSGDGPVHPQKKARPSSGSASDLAAQQAANRSTQSPVMPPRPVSRAAGPNGKAASPQMPQLLPPGIRPNPMGQSQSPPPPGTPQAMAAQMAGAGPFNRSVPQPQPGPSTLPSTGAGLTPPQQMMLRQRMAASQGMQTPSLQQQAMQNQAFASQAQMAAPRPAPTQQNGQLPGQQPPSSMAQAATLQQQPTAAQAMAPLLEQYRSTLASWQSLQTAVSSPRFALLAPQAQNTLRNQLQGFATQLGTLQPQIRAMQQQQGQQMSPGQSNQQVPPPPPPRSMAPPPNPNPAMGMMLPPQQPGQPNYGSFDHPARAPTPARAGTPHGGPASAASPAHSLGGGGGPGTPDPMHQGVFGGPRPGSVMSHHQSPGMSHAQIQAARSQAGSRMGMSASPAADPQAMEGYGPVVSQAGPQHPAGYGNLPPGMTPQQVDYIRQQQQRFAMQQLQQQQQQASAASLAASSPAVQTMQPPQMSGYPQQQQQQAWQGMDPMLLAAMQQQQQHQGQPGGQQPNGMTGMYGQTGFGSGQGQYAGSWM